ncbi:MULTISPECIES: molybdenum cofactor biosynthesis protein MoaE [unclassified Iodidimonas]|jgi:molybdopterin synthase catalytic subunit|uniref:molybdenum cofactor biosynthesis protein MoaE n=1 Tax=unclassified Iodidimonas TaxID=2626145 RepID=UPI002482333F|nr:MULTISPECIES: molybdenum cofactor biosynthesis protein MoaE [unclassified Iodidimonas]
MAPSIVRLQSEAFNIADELSALRMACRTNPESEGEKNSGIGALLSFTGLVRDLDHGTPLKSLYLEHYPAMTERQIKAIAFGAITRFSLAGCTIIHRHGRLVPDDEIVLVITAARHRKAAFAAADFIMDWLKIKAPFWKKEDLGQEQHWVAQKDSDLDAARSWEAPVHQLNKPRSEQ